MSGIQEIVEYKEKSCEFKDTKLNIILLTEPP